MTDMEQVAALRDCRIAMAAKLQSVESELEEARRSIAAYEDAGW
jgi:hypothetical protein